MIGQASELVYISALIRSRQAHQPGDFIEPMVGDRRRVMRVIERHEREVVFCGLGQSVVWFKAVDAAGGVHIVRTMDDPREADADQAAAFNGRGAFAELVERETNAAIAHADEQDARLATGVFCPTEEEIARHRR